MKGLFYILFRGGLRRARYFQQRFTTPGLFALGAVAAFAVVGMDTRQTVAYRGFTLVLAAVTASLLFTLRRGKGFSASRRLPPLATAGQTIRYAVTVKNKTARKQAGLLVFEEPAPAFPKKEEFLNARLPWVRPKNVFQRLSGWHRFSHLARREQGFQVKKHPVPVVAPGGSVRVSAEITPENRGLVSVKGLFVGRPDPLGLCLSLSRMEAPAVITVLPKRYPVPRLDLPGTRRLHRGGETLAHAVGDSQEFASIRDYRPGDPLRRIHWRSFAKAGKPVVKEFVEEYFVRHALVLDTMCPEGGGRVFEEAVSVAASFAEAAETRETLLDLVFVGEEPFVLTAGRGLGKTDDLLRALASVQPSDRDFSELAAAVLSRSGRLSGAVLVLVSWDRERKDLVKNLRAHGVPVFVLVLCETLPENPDAGPLGDAPGRLHFLPANAVAESLASL